MAARLPRPLRNLPAIVYVVLVYGFIFLPVADLVLFSFQESRVPIPPFNGPSLKWYAAVFADARMMDALLNSVLVALASSLVSVILGFLAAYALARLRFRGVELFGVAVFITYLVPQTLLFIPLIDVINFIDDYVEIRDTYWSLILTYPTFLIPFVTWLLMGYFRTIPVEVEECAYLDGCTRLGALFRVVLPMAVPGIICAILFSYTLSWNEFLYSLVFIQDEHAKTVSVGVFTELIRGDIYFWGSLMAACLLGTLPIVVLYSFLMDYYTSGLTQGAIK